LQPFNLYLVCILYMQITSNINIFGNWNILEGRWSGKCQNFNWIMDALAFWNCRLMLYIQISGCAWHWNWFVYTILRSFSKEQTSNLQSHVFLHCMLLVSEKYFRDLLSTCTACKLCKPHWVNCLVLTVL
jgi:hypothetical protein